MSCYSSSTILIVFLVSNIIIVTSSSRSIKNDNLIEQACSKTSIETSKVKQCVQILGSNPKIVSANNFKDLSIEILQSGIPSATSTSTYIEKLLRSAAGPGSNKDALQGCKDAHDGLVKTFVGALRAVKVHEYDVASYGLLTGSTDGFKRCLDDAAAGKIKDPTILRGNDEALIYGFSAFQAISIIQASHHRGGPSNGKKLF